MHGNQGLDKFVEVCKRRNVNTVLDVGCGTHELQAKYLRAHNFEVDTVDFRPNADYVGDYNEINFQFPYDAIWCCHSLEHQLNPHDFIRKISFDLKEGGTLAITVPPLKHDIVGGHVSLWNAGLLLYHLVLAGFDCSDVAIKSYDYNITVLLVKNSIDIPDLCYCNDDLKRLREFFPDFYTWDDKGFFGEIHYHNWNEFVGV